MARSGSRRSQAFRNGGSAGEIPDFDDVFGGPPSLNDPYTLRAGGEYSVIFGRAAVSCSIPFLDLPALARLDRCESGVDYDDIFCRTTARDFAFPDYEVLGLQCTSASKESGKNQTSTEEGLEVKPGNHDKTDMLFTQKDQIVLENLLPNGGLKDSNIRDENPSFRSLEEHLEASRSIQNESSQGETSQTLSLESSAKSSQIDLQNVKVQISGISSPDSEEFDNANGYSSSSSYHSISYEEPQSPDDAFLLVSDTSLHTQPSELPTPNLVYIKSHPGINRSSKENIDDGSSESTRSSQSNLQDPKVKISKEDVLSLDAIVFGASSEVSLHGQPNQVPPPPSEAPSEVLNIKKRHTRVENSEGGIEEEHSIGLTINRLKPTRESVSVISDVAVKEPVERAQAKLKIDKELLGRKRENVPERKSRQTKNNQEGEIKDMREDHGQESFSFTSVVSWDEEIADLVVTDRQKIEEDNHGDLIERSELENGKHQEIKTDKQVNEPIKNYSASDMAEISHEVKKIRKMWAFNEVHEKEEAEKDFGTFNVSRLEEEMKEVISAIREAHEKVGVEEILEENNAIGFQGDDLNRESKLGDRKCQNSNDFEDSLTLEDSEFLNRTGELKASTEVGANSEHEFEFIDTEGVNINFDKLEDVEDVRPIDKLKSPPRTTGITENVDNQTENHGSTENANFVGDHLNIDSDEINGNNSFSNLDEAVKIQNEGERERKREKERAAVAKAIREAQQRLLAKSRERADKSARAAVARVTAETRQRALAMAREKAENKAKEKASAERLQAERAAVEKAAADARERAMERAMAGWWKKEHQVEDNVGVNDKKPMTSVDASSNNKLQEEGSASNSQKTTEANDYRKDSDIESDVVQCNPSLTSKETLEKSQRTVDDRMAKALAEKNMRDNLAQMEQKERNRLAESLDAEVKRWSNGKEENLRALLSTLQYILGQDIGWQAIPVSDLIANIDVKKAYRKAALCVHPDKLQQRGATIHQKYICEKVFDVLKRACNKFNSEER